MRTPTIRDVAAAAAVSHQTVSRVLNNPEQVLPATRTRVETAIAQLGYVRNDAAAQLGRRRRHPTYTSVAAGSAGVL